MRIHFDCESAALASAQELSPTAIAETIEVIEADDAIRGARVLGFYSPTQELGRDDLAEARARTVAELLRRRTGLPVASEGFGAAPATTYPEPCMRQGTPAERAHVERFATVEVLRCRGASSP